MKWTFLLGLVGATNLAVDWNLRLLEAVADAKASPLFAARALGLLNLAAFDAWALHTTDVKSISFDPALRGSVFSAEAREVAVNHSAAEMMAWLFPARFHGSEEEPGVDAPAKLGKLVALTIIGKRAHDGANVWGDFKTGGGDWTGYRAANSPCDPRESCRAEHPLAWQPLLFYTTQNTSFEPPFLGAHWHTIAPIAIASSSALRPPPPIMRPDSKEYREQLDRTVELTAGLTENQKRIARYWADGPGTATPPGHWFLFAAEVVRRDAMTLDRTVPMLTALGIAMFDASIATWDAKRYYNYARPITAIRHRFRGARLPLWDNRTVAGERWVPFQPENSISPPFPEYTSGHSAFSAAGASVLRRFSGSDRFGLQGFETFSRAATQAGFSRQLGGIHFKQGNLQGAEIGKACAQTAVAFIQARMS